jgi:hypothetical protein
LLGTSGPAVGFLHGTAVSGSGGVSGADGLTRHLAAAQFVGDLTGGGAAHARGATASLDHAPPHAPALLDLEANGASSQLLLHLRP